MGLELTGRIGRIVIDPANPDIVLVAALGHCYGPQKERGVFKTKDGGKTWEHVLIIDEDTGVFEIAMDPSNPRKLLAGAWPLEIKTYGRRSGGPNGGIYMSDDQGETWQRLTGRGLPEPPIGKVGIAYSHSNPKVVYAIMETGAPNRGVLWRSGNGGESWTCVSYNRILNERSHYASRIMVNPADENEVYFAANSHSITYDGGYTSETSGWSGDSHDMWADPLIPDRMMISDDGGAQITMNRGKTWNNVKLPIAQMYHVYVDNQIPYYVYGGMQDGPAYKGPSIGGGGRGGSSQWESTAGGECGFIVPDPVNANIVWGGSYNAALTRVDYTTGHLQTVKPWPESAYGAAANEVKYRFNWTFPIAISPHNHNKVYAGSQYVHMTTNAGRSWTIISPDLSTNDPSMLGPSGWLTRDNLAVEYGCCVFAIAESPVEEGCIWAGTNDGLVQVTRNGGEKWTNVTGNIPNLLPCGTISNLEPSSYDTGTCYVTIDFHQMNNRDPFVYKTTNYGRTWKSISSDIPRSVFSYCHWVHEDPVRPGLLYLGTENAIYVSFNDGENWLPLQNNLPHAPVHHMVVQEHFNDLVVGTYGRGFWIMDDITPLQQLTDYVLKSNAHLFAPRQAYRMHRITGGPGVSTNANINYYLKSAPRGDITITIEDEFGGETINTLSGSGRPGINRVSWNLKYPAPRQVKLRIKPPGNPRVVEEKRFRETWEREGWYPLMSWGTSGGFSGPTVAPGTYTITLSVEGRKYVEKLEVLKDPRSAGSLRDIRETVAMQLELRDNISATTDMLNQIEWARKQLVDLKDICQAGNGPDEIMAAADRLDKKIQTLEDKVMQPMSREGDSKSFRYPNMLYSKLSVLAGDVASNVDFAPNQQQQQVHDLLKGQMADYLGQWKKLCEDDITAFNRLLRSNNMGAIIIPQVN
ncbi:WD40/YVTN/BNR-like repeat-containing protein [Planctomycetota bacterium]